MSRPTIRTSASHPLRIDIIDAGTSGGQIGITFCPGKQATSVHGAPWKRDLGVDLDVIAQWRPSAVITLIEDHEFRLLGVTGLGAEVKARGIDWHHLPIVDVSPPDQRFAEAWPLVAPSLLDVLRDGGKVLVHCRGGLGRAGTVAARLLVDLGATPEDAIRQVRKARPGAIETRAQQDYILKLAPPKPWRKKAMDWFEALTGFRESSYDDTRRQLDVVGESLVSKANGRRYGIGRLELVPVQTLRDRVDAIKPRDDGWVGRIGCSIVQGDVREKHSAPEFEGALFQVASQFNLLEMTSPTVTPEDGVTRYQGDPTQGPACAMAAGAATIYRNYFAPVGHHIGQTSEQQLDALADLDVAFALMLDRPFGSLWTMQNGYAMCNAQALGVIERLLQDMDSESLERIRGIVRIGLHWDVEVTDGAGARPGAGPLVSQAFCSALPVSYNNVPRPHWKPFAALVLEAAYEGTLLAAYLNAQRGASKIVLLTRLGGGAFGNDDQWIDDAMFMALRRASPLDLDVRLVSHGKPRASLIDMAMRLNRVGALDELGARIPGSDARGGHGS